jgi:phosphate starvation-inducible PhoH-like protein
MPTDIADPLRDSCSIDLVLPQSLCVLFSAREATHNIEAALQPYALRATPIERGVNLAGEKLAVTLAEKTLEKLQALQKQQSHVDLKAVDEAVHAVIKHALRYDLVFRLEGVRHPVCPLSLGQVAFLDVILSNRHALTFGVGPTGTGKTHLALAAALCLLAREAVQHIVITRPHVLWEGEVVTAARRADIVDEGQLTPIDDELYALIGREAAGRLKSQGRLEIVPLGCLRGRTFNDSIILVDEAQNLLIPQMRMVLTRLGRNSRMIIIGDPEQTDLHGLELSGLPQVLRMIEGRGFSTVHKFQHQEIVRNPVVAELEALYRRTEKRADDAGETYPHRRSMWS